MSELIVIDGPGAFRAGALDQSSRPAIVITGVVADQDHISTTIISDLSDITCIAGASLTVTGELRAESGEILPVTARFRMPLRARDGREKVLLAEMSEGRIIINARLRESGVWSVTEQSINEVLPVEQQMSFAGICIFVVES